jgi:hypothetical protein
MATIRFEVAAHSMAPLLVAPYGGATSHARALDLEIDTIQDGVFPFGKISLARQASRRTTNPVLENQMACVSLRLAGG